MDRTLISVVQSTLGAMDSDAVNSIGETLESQQVALVASEVYEEMVTYQRIPQLCALTQLVGIGDLARPTVMLIPDNCTDIIDVRYRHTLSNGKTEMMEIAYLDPDSFLDRQLALDVTRPDVGFNTMAGNVVVPFRNSEGPCYWTTFDDEEIVFDSIDTVLQGDSTLYNDASMVRAYIIPDFTMTDDFVIPLPRKMFPQYLNQVKERAFSEQKQTGSEVSTRNADREMHRNRHFGGIADGLDQGTEVRRSYGRRARSYGRSYRVTSRGLPRVR